MYSVNDIGNIALICVVMCVVFGLLGASEIWPMAAGLAFIVFVAFMLHK